jgi:UDP-N-acetylmuramoyl-L-alanyl-D-glutamate--2,6-diaminopimelate ligase
MKSIETLIQNLKNFQFNGNEKEMVAGLTMDSRNTDPNFLYAAMKGTQVDGHDFIGKAIELGATVILHESEVANVEGISYIQVSDITEALGEIALQFYDEAANQLVIVGTTGTNGKTTVSTLLFELFTKLGYESGLVSTVENRIGNKIIPSTHTTPNVIALHALFAQMVEEGCTHCFMEVSSHAIDQNRIAGIKFAGGIFTNITHDHLDYHKTFDNYIKAKKRFFDQLPAESFAITNKDDKNGMVMLQNCKATKYSYGLRGTADFKVRVLESDFNGMLVQINGKDIWTSLVGEFNAYNFLAVYGAAFLITEGIEEIEIPLSALGRVNGRFEAIAGTDNKTAIIDYAHTPDALENVIKTINNIRQNGVKLITVVGCGGNRDAEKRPQMGGIAARLSDKVIFTSDNPRNEDPNTIINQMEAGVEVHLLKKILKITDRKEALKTAILLSDPGDVILVAGKGHETYQEIQGIKHSFDDKKIMAELFNQLK